jgi:hypothetical protein
LVWTISGRAAPTLRNISTGGTTKHHRRLGLNLERKEYLGKALHWMGKVGFEGNPAVWMLGNFGLNISTSGFAELLNSVRPYDNPGLVSRELRTLL